MTAPLILLWILAPRVRGIKLAIKSANPGIAIRTALVVRYGCHDANDLRTGFHTARVARDDPRRSIRIGHQLRTRRRIFDTGNGRVLGAKAEGADTTDTIDRAGVPSG